MPDRPVHARGPGRSLSYGHLRSGGRGCIPRLRPSGWSVRGTRLSRRLRPGGRTIRRQATSGPASTREGPLDLVARARKGDRESFNELVDLHVADLYRLALVVAGPELAEDVTQDAFLAAWQQLPRLRDPERFVPWLRRILVNRARDLHRAERRRLL
ncbi:MAG TPA: sigma factor, partial [Verrucomicrobiae bacterium]|nr:sigma factor [Verrucomicrobiae bacterium]